MESETAPATDGAGVNARLPATSDNYHEGDEHRRRCNIEKGGS